MRRSTRLTPTWRLPLFLCLGILGWGCSRTSTGSSPGTQTGSGGAAVPPQGGHPGTGGGAAIGPGDAGQVDDGTSGGAGGGGRNGASDASGGAFGNQGGPGGSVIHPDGGGAGADAGPTSCAEPPPADSLSVSIAGQWDFTPQGGAPTKIQVPGGGWIKQGFTAPSATYATTVSIPDTGSAQTTLLEFGAINHQATLTIGGTLVGTNMTAFTPSVFDITKFVTPGRAATISLLVRGRDALRNSAGRRIVPAAADWSPYVPQGIFRSAVIRAFPDIYISDAFVRPSVKADSLSYDVWLTNTGAASRQVVLSGALDSWNCDPFIYRAVPSSTLTVPAGTTQKVTVGPLPWGLGPTSYWWPNVPYRVGYEARLHNLRISIGEPGRTLHTRVVRFGFRDSEQRQTDAQHSNYYLNGVRVNFRGDSLQGVDYDSINSGGFGDAYDTLPGFLPPTAQNPGWPQAVRNYQRLNYNVVRIHQELAAPYMIDVADELGLMLIDETAIRGTDGQDFVTGHDNMVNHLRALVLRDRNHPSVIRWSQSNEENLSPTDSVAFAGELYDAIMALDATRPVSADLSGAGRDYDAIVHPNFATYGHYLNGLGSFTDEVGARADRPFGQGEFVWPSDVTAQGLMWFATGTEGMRAKDASEIRPYTLLSGWASVIPGVTTTSMRLEPTYPAGVINPPQFGEDNLPDPFSHPTLVRVQRAYNPLLVADQAYWDANKLSNARGDWPTVVPALTRNADVTRRLTIFNDTFAGTSVAVTWEVRAETPTGNQDSTGTFAVEIPLGSRATHDITLHTPTAGTRMYLVLRAAKDGATLFEDAAEAFTLN